jgi:hypothetical protein
VGARSVANRRKYIAGFIVLCWIAIAALIGIFIGLAHLLNNTTATIIVFQLIIYSGLFGFLGAHLFKWKGKRDGWPSRKRSDRGWGNPNHNGLNEPDEAEDSNSGWK